MSTYATFDIPENNSVLPNFDFNFLPKSPVAPTPGVPAANSLLNFNLTGQANPVGNYAPISPQELSFGNTGPLQLGSKDPTQLAKQFQNPGAPTTFNNDYDPGVFSREGMFGDSGWFMPAVQGLGAVSNIYFGLKSLGLAEDQFDFQKSAYTEQLANSRQSYNNQYDSQTARNVNALSNRDLGISSNASESERQEAIDRYRSDRETKKI